jgi:hypothetical protein
MATVRRIKKAAQDTRPVKKTTVVQADNTELETAISNYVDLRTKIEDAEKTKKEIGHDILTMLERRKIDQYVGKAGKATAVYPVSAGVLDPDRLMKRIGATMWNKITTRVLDHNKLEAFIKSGEISQRDVAACTSDPVEGTPHVRVTKR